jgi:ABC-type bacteriocin/lantibiotic exporter with double-glycine peptidase domain
VAQFIASFGVAFYSSWQLTIVLIAAVPLYTISGAYMISAVTESTNKAHEQYAKAGGLATESLNAVRTVTALNMQPDVISRYRKYLFEALRVGIIKGLKVGFFNGAIFSVDFLTNGLGFWYGGNLVADDMEGCTNNCVTGGMILAAYLSVSFGSMALGQVSRLLSLFLIYLHLILVHFRWLHH